MARTIAQRELRNDNAKIMDAVAAGEEFVVTRNGTPIARITPITGKRTFVPLTDLLALIDRSERIDYAQFRADMDAVVDPYLRDPYESRG